MSTIVEPEIDLLPEIVETAVKEIEEVAKHCSFTSPKTCSLLRRIQETAGRYVKYINDYKVPEIPGYEAPSEDALNRARAIQVLVLLDIDTEDMGTLATTRRDLIRFVRVGNSMGKGFGVAIIEDLLTCIDLVIGR